jgi:hypothetical protein
MQPIGGLLRLAQNFSYCICLGSGLGKISWRGRCQKRDYRKHATYIATRRTREVVRINTIPTRKELIHFHSIVIVCHVMSCHVCLCGSDIVCACTCKEHFVWTWWASEYLSQWVVRKARAPSTSVNQTSILSYSFCLISLSIAWSYQRQGVLHRQWYKWSAEQSQQVIVSAYLWCRFWYKQLPDTGFSCRFSFLLSVI